MKNDTTLGSWEPDPGKLRGVGLDHVSWAPVGLGHELPITLYHHDGGLGWVVRLASSWLERLATSDPGYWPDVRELQQY